MQAMRYTFRLFGPRRGQTVNLNGHQFINGECQFVSQPDKVGFAAKVLSHYGAFVKGTPEYEAALAKEQEEDGISGKADPEEGSGQATEVSSGDGEAGRSAESKATDDGAGHADDSEGSAGSGSNGNGHSDTGVPNFEEAASIVPPQEPEVLADGAVAEAVRKLDPDNDAHWTSQGLPRLSAVEDALGRAGVTRSDVESAAPGLTRETASL